MEFFIIRFLMFCSFIIGQVFPFDDDEFLDDSRPCAPVVKKPIFSKTNSIWNLKKRMLSFVDLPQEVVPADKSNDDDDSDPKLRNSMRNSFLFSTKSNLDLSYNDDFLSDDPRSTPMVKDIFRKEKIKFVLESQAKRRVKNIYKRFFVEQGNPQFIVHNNVFDSFMDVSMDCLDENFTEEAQETSDMNRKDQDSKDKCKGNRPLNDRIFDILEEMTVTGLTIKNPSEKCWHSLMSLCNLYDDSPLKSDLMVSIDSPSSLLMLENCRSAASLSLDLGNFVNYHQNGDKLASKLLPFKFSWKHQRQKNPSAAMIPADLVIRRLSFTVGNEDDLEFLSRNLKTGLQVQELDLSFMPCKTTSWLVRRPKLKSLDHPKVECFMDYNLSPQIVKKFVSSVTHNVRLIIRKSPVYLAKTLVSHRLANLHPNSNNNNNNIETVDLQVNQFVVNQIGFLENVRGEAVYTFFRELCLEGNKNHFKYFAIDLKSNDKWMPRIFDEITNKVAVTETKAKETKATETKATETTATLSFTQFHVRLQDGMEDQVSILFSWLKAWSSKNVSIGELCVILTDNDSKEIDDDPLPLPQWEQIADFLNGRNLANQIYYITMRDERNVKIRKWQLPWLMDMQYTESYLDPYHDIMKHYYDDYSDMEEQQRNSNEYAILSNKMMQNITKI